MDAESFEAKAIAVIEAELLPAGFHKDPTRLGWVNDSGVFVSLQGIMWRALEKHYIEMLLGKERYG